MGPFQEKSQSKSLCDLCCCTFVNLHFLLNTRILPGLLHYGFDLDFNLDFKITLTRVEELTYFPTGLHHEESDPTYLTMHF